MSCDGKPRAWRRDEATEILGPFLDERRVRAALEAGLFD